VGARLAILLGQRRCHALFRQCQIPARAQHPLNRICVGVIADQFYRSELHKVQICARRSDSQADLQCLLAGVRSHLIETRRLSPSEYQLGDHDAGWEPVPVALARSQNCAFQ
jgi:hypothetical protein